MALQDVDDVLDALCAVAEYQQLKPDWIPRLSDPDDEPLLQMAVEAQTHCLCWYVASTVLLSPLFGR